MRRTRYAVVGLVVVAAGGIAISGAPITLGTTVPVPAASSVWDVTIADVTGDGHGDVILPPWGSPKLVIHPGNGDGTLGTPIELATSAEKYSSRVYTALLNDDAAEDIVIDHYGTPTADVFLSDGSGGFTRTSYTETVVGDTYRQLALADWDGDGDLDLVTVSMGMGSKVRVRLNLGGGTFGDVHVVEFTETRDPLSVAYGCIAADFDADGDVDVATTNANTVAIYWQQPDGRLDFSSWVTHLGSSFNGRNLLAADVDGDGYPDLVSSGGMTPSIPGWRGGILVFRHATATTFAAAEEYPDDIASTTDIAAADLNGDGFPEIITPTSLHVNAGDGTFAPAIALPAAGPRGVGVGNFDADAHPDIVCVTSTLGAFVFPVQTSGPLPRPSVAQMTPGFLSIGASSDVVILGSAFQAGVTADFGAGVTLNSLTRDSSAKLRANVTVSAGAASGARTVSVTNPDTGTSTFTYQVLVGGAATVTKLVPAEAHEGDTLEVVVEGAGFVAGATADLGTGVTVRSIDALADDSFRMTLDVAVAAPLGTRDLTLRNGSGATTVLPDAFKILRRRSLDVTVEGGRLTTARRRGRGRFTARGSIAFNAFSPDGKFDPVTESAEVRLGAPTAPVVVAIGPDTGWTLRGKKASWRSPRGAKPKLHLQLDFAKQTFRIFATNVTLPPQSAGPVLVEATLGDETGTSVRLWTRLRGSGGKVLVLR